MSIIKIKINNQLITCDSEQTILEVAKKNKIEIPSLCAHPDFPAKGNCRVCEIEVKDPTTGRTKLVTACSTVAQNGMEIFTDTDRVAKSRNLNIELIFAEHIEKCPTCIWRPNCPLLRMAEKYNINIKRLPDRKAKRQTYKFANAVEIDGTQCIDCRNCLDACNQMQKINYLELEGKGIRQEVVPTKDKKIDCIYCGQCAVHCPVSAAQEQSEWEQVEKLFKQKGKIVVAQFAPSIRVSIGEEFGLAYGDISTGQMVTALKRLGFSNVFDVNFAADITTVVEAEELVDRVKNKGQMPMFTSCCPAWVKYVEFYRPDLIPNLTTSRSPQIHSGGVIKTYWAKTKMINPKDIIVVSIMPCTSKKFEAQRKELKVNGLYPVDYVLTTRELAWMIKKNNIDFATLPSGEPDSPLAEFTGAAAIYGASGGVMESALRTAQFLICGEKEAELCGKRLEFNDVRGINGVKEAEVNIAGKVLRVAVVNGIGNIKPVLANLKKYDYIEVMACPGGCIGGGGQPIPTTWEIRKARIEALYKLDKSKTIRKAHENKGVSAVFGWLKKQGKLEHQVLHTTYKKRSKSIF